jgi:hypothetical protein
MKIARNVNTYGHLRRARADESRRTAERYVAAANSGIRTTRAEYLSYLLLLTYIAIAAGTTTHRQLLLSAPVKLPLLDVSVPMTAFYAMAPVLIVVLHFEILWRSAVVAGRIQCADAAIATLPRADAATVRAQLELALIPVSLAEARQRILKVLISGIAWLLGVLAPVLVLLSLQIAFLPYHSESITWWHRILIMSDVAIAYMFWPNLDTVASKLPRTSIRERSNPAIRPVARLINIGLQRISRLNLRRWRLATLAVTVALFSLGIATIPVEHLEIWIVAHSPASWIVARPGIPGRAQMLRLTCLLFEQEVCVFPHALPLPHLYRNLVITDSLIVAGEPSPEITARLQQRQDEDVI